MHRTDPWCLWKPCCVRGEWFCVPFLPKFVPLSINFWVPLKGHTWVRVLYPESSFMAFHTLKQAQSPSYLADGAAWQSPDFIFDLRMVKNKVSRLYDPWIWNFFCRLSSTIPESFIQISSDILEIIYHTIQNSPPLRNSLTESSQLVTFYWL